MKVIDALGKSERPAISLEIVPPERGADLADIYQSIELLLEFKPKFVTVTNHQLDDFLALSSASGFRQNKRPGTVSVCLAIKSRYQVETVPHLIRARITKYDFEDILIDLKFLGLENIFIIRGDPPPSAELADYARQAPSSVNAADRFVHASEMVRQAAEMNQGNYLSAANVASRPNFCVGVAGYPEKHCEAPSKADDIARLKHKVDQGADYIITQMFFDFDYYKNFAEQVREAGINVPIIPGIKPVVSRKSLHRVGDYFDVNIPPALLEAFAEARTPAEEFAAGTEYMGQLVRKLIDYGAPGLHFFTMSRGKSTYALLKRVFG